MKNGELKHISDGLRAAGTIVFLLLIYAPLTIYCSNCNDFSFDIFDLLKYFVPLSIVCFFISAFVLMMFNRISMKLYYAVETILYALLLGFFIQGNFFSGYLPTLTGEEPLWSTFSSYRYFSIVIWIASAAVALAVCRIPYSKRAAVQKGFCRILTAFLLVTVILSCFGNTACLDKKPGTRISNDYMLDMSSDENMVIIVLDALDSVNFSDSLKDNPEWKETFRDFTYYNDAMCCYDLTAFSVPFILSDHWFYNEEPYWNYVSNSLNNSELISSLQQSGYRMGMYDDSVPLAPGSAELFENVYEENSFSSPLSFCKLIIRLVAFKYMPHDLKPFFYASPDDITYNTLKGDSNSDHFSWENRAFYDIMLNNTIKICSEKCFRFIHIRGSHGGYRFDRFLNPSDNAGFKDGTAGAVFAVDYFIRLLKGSNAYDNSAIVIMADHGRADEDRSLRTNPVLLVKGFNEHHDFSISEIPVSYSESVNTFLSLLNGKNSIEAVSAHAGERMYYEWNVEDNTSWLVELSQSGKATDSNTLAETGNVFKNNSYGREIEKYSIG